MHGLDVLRDRGLRIALQEAFGAVFGHGVPKAGIDPDLPVFVRGLGLCILPQFLKLLHGELHRSG